MRSASFLLLLLVVAAGVSVVVADVDRVDALILTWTGR